MLQISRLKFDAYVNIDYIEWLDRPCRADNQRTVCGPHRANGYVSRRRFAAQFVLHRLPSTIRFVRLLSD